MVSIMRWVGLRDAASRAALAELHAMSAQQLADLGITRDQIEAYVAGRMSPPRRRGRPHLRLIVGGAA